MTKKGKALNIPEECYNIITESLTNNGFLGKVSKANVQDVVRHYLNEDRLHEQIELIEKYVPVQGRFLEIGSGFGGLVAFLNIRYNKSCDAYGVEPSADAYEGTILCTELLARENEIKSKYVCAKGESLPFKKDCFDIVYSTSVLEHVENPRKVICESVRILKSGGILQFVIPNYGSWWEGHYGLPMLPSMPKWAFKIYVRLIGRDENYVDTLQFIKRGDIEKILYPISDQIEVLGWGVSLWESRLRTLQFSEWAALGSLKRLVKWVHRLKMVQLVIWLGNKRHWETPFVLTLRKK
jgi:SAM-dependent methyltransferase